MQTAGFLLAYHTGSGYNESRSMACGIPLYPPGWDGRRPQSGPEGTLKFALYLPKGERQQEVLQLNNTQGPNRAARSSSIHDMVLLALFTAIIFLMAYTPIGLIDLPLIKATILHVPVIIGAILLGPRKGAFLGGMFGLTSLIKNTMAPSALSFAFSPFIPVPGTQSGSLWALVICFAPRILVGLVSGLVYRGLTRLLGKKAWSMTFAAVAAAVIGAFFMNTGLVMGLIYLLFKDAYATMKDIPVSAVQAAILGVVAANGIPEAIAAAILVPAVSMPLQKALRRGAAQ